MQQLLDIPSKPLQKVFKQYLEDMKMLFRWDQVDKGKSAKQRSEDAEVVG